MPDPNKISFDYDGTLTQAKYRDKAKAFITDGKTVFIITSRQESNSKAVYKVAEEIGIPKSQVYFTNGQLKWQTVKRLNIGTHYDNNPVEIDAIKKNTNANAILVTQDGNQDKKSMNKHINQFLTTGDPWAIAPGWLEKIHAIANREHDFEAVLKQRGEPMKNTRTVEKRGNVAVIPLMGVLFPRANMMTELSGATSLQMFGLDFAAAEADPAITDIVIRGDGPGGVTTLVHETARMINQSKKPVTFYVEGQAASATYMVAAGAKNIVMDAMAQVGSIGVVSQINTQKQDGTLEIVSSNAPDKRPDFSTPEGQAVQQAVVDAMETVFINAVAEFRGITPDKVKAARGGMLVGQNAIDAGLADRLGSLEGVIQSLNKTPSTNQSRKMDINTLKLQHPDTYQAVIAEGKALAQSELAEKTTAAATLAATAERTRMSAILACDEAKGREALAQHIAFNTAMTTDDAKAMLAASPATVITPEKPVNPLLSAMGNIKNPSVAPDKADGGDGGDDATVALAHANNMAATLNKMRPGAKTA